MRASQARLTGRFDGGRAGKWRHDPASASAPTIPVDARRRRRQHDQAVEAERDAACRRHLRQRREKSSSIG